MSHVLIQEASQAEAAEVAQATPLPSTKWVYALSEGNAHMRELLGGKGAGLAEMTRIGLPVPPGFIISTQACNAYLAQHRQWPDGLWEQVRAGMAAIETEHGYTFGGMKKPLLISVRSGAKFSMPGMMDTVLNLGLNDATLPGLIAYSQNPRFAHDAYRRLIQMFGKVVLGIEARKFEAVLDQYKRLHPVHNDAALTNDDLISIVAEFKEIILRETSKPFPQDPYEQLRLAIEAVFHSWNGRRAIDYRNAMKIPHDLGTAVNIVMMVFGNMDDQSASGVAFTRSPATGNKEIYGEYLINAQGEDVVAGIRTPRPILYLKDEMPEAYREFARICHKLERHYKDVQDVEFTIERGKLWMLQTRTGKRTAQAAVKIAVDLADENIISRAEAVARVTPAQVDMLLHPRFDDDAKRVAIKEGRLLATGLNASPGAAVGAVAFSPDIAVEWHEVGRPTILVRPETTPDDVHGMLKAKGILTQHGGATSHAAVVARGIGLPCVSGCEAIKVDLDVNRFTVSERAIIQGDIISIDGTSGEVFVGELPMVRPKYEEQTDLVRLLHWADEVRDLQVWANADYPRDAERARQFGAQGIGLCRTEHMFFETDRLPIVRQMILAHDAETRQQALNKLLPIQREDFKGILRAMQGKPVIIRLIDPPLHEFLPSHDELLTEVTEMHARGDQSPVVAQKEAMLKAVEDMREMNPMLGLRGVRVGIVWPEINRMQVRAIFEAACELQSEGIAVYPEIMIPLTMHSNELKVMRELLEDEAHKVIEEKGVELKHKFGTMIEVPRAALTADQIATHADFFSFGTNDLTQMTLGISRDDAEGKFLLEYVQKKLLPANPFQQIDVEGVGKLVRMAVEAGRATNPKLEVGVCGEHGGDPASIAFFHKAGLDYVSCSPYRVPIARLAAAHVALGETFRDV